MATLQEFRTVRRVRDAGNDGYLGRLSKYIPAEIVGLYVAASGLIPENLPEEGRETALWWIFGVCFALTPLYLIFVTPQPGKGVLWLQVILGTIAFPVWIFALGGPFEAFDWYQGWIASIVLLVVTAVFGLFKPKEPRHTI